MRRALLVAAWAALVLAIPLWVPPHAAFAASLVDDRAVGADVVTHTSGYVAFAWPSCSVPTSGGECQLTLTNKATVPVRFIVTLATDSPDTVDTYAFPGRTAVAAGAMETTGEIAVGASETLTVTILSCACGGEARTPTWDVEAVQTTEMRAIVSGYQTLITYTEA